MKRNEKGVRDKMVVLRLNSKEYETLLSHLKKSTDTTVSNYLRKLATNKPVTVKYRNATADDFLREMILLKNELNAIGNNYNQAVKKLHLIEKIPEFRNWIQLHDQTRMSFLNKVEAIHNKVVLLYERWLQK